MKRLIMLIAAVMMLSGCVTHTELDKIAIVEVLGIDRENDEYTITMQYFNTDAAGGVTAVDSSAPNTVTVSSGGSSIESALEAVSYTSGKEIMLGSAGMIIFGKDAITSMRDSLSFAAAHYSGNPRAYVAAADGKAADIIRVKFTEGNASVEKLEMMLSNAENLGLTSQVRLYEAMESLCGPTDSVALPMIATYQGNPDLTEDGTGIIITGGAVCTDGEYRDSLSVPEMSGLAFIAGGSGKCEMTLRYRGEDVRVMLYGINTKITPSFEDGALELDIYVKADCKYVSTSMDKPYENKGDIESLCEKEIITRITSALDTCLGKHGADVFGLEYKIRSHSPDIWKSIAENYSDHLKNAVYNVHSDVNMERFGIMHG